MSEDFKNPFGNSGNLMAQLKKAKEEQDRKIAAEKARIAKEEADAELLRRQEEERRRKEQEAAEREIQRQKIEAEARAKAEAERAVEEERQRLVQEKNKRTFDAKVQIESILPQMKRLNKKGVKASASEISSYINQFETIKQTDANFDSIESYQEAYNIYLSLIEISNKIYIRNVKKDKTAKRIKIISIIVLGVAIVCASIFGIYKYVSSDSFKQKTSERAILKQERIEENQRIKNEKEHQKLLKKYKVGGKGEAGIIFYDKGSYSDGWRFLEYAEDYFKDVPFANTNQTFEIPLYSKLGEGYINTYLIIEAYGTSCAAYKAASYDGGGKNDWYLGNEAEMNALYKMCTSSKKTVKKMVKNEVLSGMGDYIGDCSRAYLISEMEDSHALTKHFIKRGSVYFDKDAPGATIKLGNITCTSYDYKYHTFVTCVRPIRKF